MPKKPDPVDALLRSGPRRVDLPAAEQRARLRADYGLTQAEIADALGVTRATVAGWEAGRSEPQGPTRAAYAKLLDGIAAQLTAPPPQPRHLPLYLPQYRLPCLFLHLFRPSTAGHRYRDDRPRARAACRAAEGTLRAGLYQLRGGCRRPGLRRGGRRCAQVPGRSVGSVGR